MEASPMLFRLGGNRQAAGCPGVIAPIAIDFGGLIAVHTRRLFAEQGGERAARAPPARQAPLALPVRPLRRLVKDDWPMAKQPASTRSERRSLIARLRERL